MTARQCKQCHVPKNRNSLYVTENALNMFVRLNVRHETVVSDLDK